MDYLSVYTRFLKSFLKPKRKLRVVFDCSNGSAGIILARLFQESKNIEAILVNEKPDGNFPAHGPDPLQLGALDQLAEAVIKNKADLGAIFDADADRVFFVDDKGRAVYPDVATTLFCQNFKGAVVLTIDVGLLPREWLVSRKRKVFDTRVGSYFIKQMIKKYRAEFGAEYSSHFYFKKFFNSDSGILGSILMTNIVSKLKQPLSEWIDALPKFYRSGLMNFPISAGKSREEVIQSIEEHYKDKAKEIIKIDGLKVILSSEAWFLIRSSNTEPLLRLTFESKDKAVFEKELEVLKGLLTNI